MRTSELIGWIGVATGIGAVVLLLPSALVKSHSPQPPHVYLIDGRLMVSEGEERIPCAFAHSKVQVKLCEEANK